jgi:hypothetical protein
MSRTLGILKKTSLAGLAENWGEECYVLTTPVTYPQILVIQKMKVDEKDPDPAVLATIKMIKDHLAGGKVKVYENEELKLVNIEADDVDGMSVEMTDHIFASITGGAHRDPKVSPSAAESEPTPSSSENTTETP